MVGVRRRAVKNSGAELTAAGTGERGFLGECVCAFLSYIGILKSS